MEKDGEKWKKREGGKIWRFLEETMTIALGERDDPSEELRKR